MKELKSVDYKLLWELIKDSRRSDRQLAKDLGLSQPTVTRKRNELEKNFLEGYTAIPKWDKIGFQIIVFTFINARVRYVKIEEWDEVIRKGRQWFLKQPNVLFAAHGEGMGWDIVCISIHKSYPCFASFKRKYDRELSDLVHDSQSFIVDLSPGVVAKQLNFKYLAELE